jgi:phage antirepressor YoqD-like protein
MIKRINRPQVFKMLYEEGFLYKSKTITQRTVRTMFDNGFFSSKEWSDIGRCWTVLESEVLENIKEKK